MNPRNQERKAEYCFELEGLTSRRDVLVETVKEEKQRLEKNPEERVIRSIESHIKFLQSEIKEIESEIRAIMEKKPKKSEKYYCRKKESVNKRRRF